MAKVSPSLISLKGKVGDMVFVQKKDGTHTRKSVEPGSKKDEPALKRQYSRTRYLNNLASEINTIIGAQASIKNSSFYQQLLKCFRKEPLKNRFLLVMRLKNLEVNPKYKLSKNGSCSLNVERIKKDMIVSLHVLLHPGKRPKKNANTYCFEVLLVYWNKSNKKVGVTKQYSDWIWWNADKPTYVDLPVFDFTFSIPTSTSHWFVAVRRTFGEDEKLIGDKATDGMQIMEVGTWDKKEAAMLAKRRKQVSSVVRPAEVQPVRVKARAARTDL